MKWLLLLLLTFSAQAKTVIVQIKGYRFVPSVVTIRVGDSIKWINNTKSEHNIVLDKTVAGWIHPGDEMMIGFFTAHKYIYYCTPHRAMGMTGRIIVK